MNFDYTQEQRQFSDAVSRWIEKDYGIEARRAIIHGKVGVSEEAWQALTELGVPALPIPASAGGLDGSLADMFIIMEQLGRGLVVEPVIATAMGAECLRLAGGQDALLEQVSSGTLTMACAFGERQSRHELFDVASSARLEDGHYHLDGTKTVVLHGAQAGQLIVSARTAGTQRDASGIALFLVPAHAAGLSRRDYRTIDGLRAADIQLSDVCVPTSALLAPSGSGWDLLEAVIDHGIVLMCGEAIGAMEALNAATLEYLKTRQQFGVAIGSFQVLQHRMVDMAIHLAQARAVATLAATRLSTPLEAEERKRMASAAKVRVGQAMRFISQQAVQLHGGMGLSDELPVSHYVKRLTILESTLGDTDHHLARFAGQPQFLGDVAAA
ncbi:acyl-CoA dehydrogenase family protein [Achromobacter aloeverae]|uniref:Pimeloyl-CoA dehydrogenase small subunit n=1 Tax=Achromobacter aloeverae TaxID=1750518 RepID=A0A4Q1HIL8_9BURK|nr:acyl-CoA dehydrogenase family protein [Achromobacter aloeverae]RXN88048.1 pimeloyl-CoA dehydrogenase small subunit [Achromobacter aloeverae]